MDNIWSGGPTDDDLPDAQDIVVDVVSDGDEPRFDEKTGALEIPTGDGGLIVSFGNKPTKETGFGDNLAEGMQEGELSRIAMNLLEGIEADNKSRAEWLSTRERGIELLGLKIEDPQGDVGGSTAPVEGMSRTRHPVLLEATLKSQATACSALLPAAGPAKAEVIGEATEETYQLAEVLEADFNDYLTNRAPEYYPDTRRSLFWSSFGGSSFKKVFSCPLRMRPVSESVDAKDMIISAGATDLINATRVTQQIITRPSMMKRLQLAGVYRDVPLGQPTPEPNQVDQKKAEVEGLSIRIDRPEDQPYTVYECYCELDLDEFAPKQFKGKSVPLPYRVTVEKDSRQILEIRRNWKEGDPQCLRRKTFVKYPYVEGMGIYGIGLLNILGNSTTALTAAWRIMLDNGMFANFPGGIVDKAASRQLSNEFRIPPGGMVQLDFGGRNASQVYGQLPYRNLDNVFVQFITSMQQTTERVGGAAETPVGEGKQDAPVGTTLALIEQQTKVESEVHKGLCTAQAEELQLIRECFREDPSAFWRHNPRSKTLKLMMQQRGLTAFEQDEEKAEKRKQDLFLAALNACEIVPVADPNTPTHLHRLMKVQGLVQLAGRPNSRIDQEEVDRIAIRMLGFDAETLILPPAPPSTQPDPNVLKAQAELMKAQASLMSVQQKAQSGDRDAQIKLEQMQADVKIAEMNLEKEKLIHESNIQQTVVKSQGDAMRQSQKLRADFVNRQMDRQAGIQKHRQTIAAGIHKHERGLAANSLSQMLDHAHQRVMTSESQNGAAN